MSKGNTLFNYFSKKPASASGEESSEKKSDVLGPTNKANTPVQNGHSVAKSPKAKKPECAFEPLDLVWARLEGYPWWPSLVCTHPKSDVEYTRPDGKRTLVHVQFFDDPPTRGWVKERFMKKFEGSGTKDYERGGQFFTSNPTCRRGVVEADKALPLSRDERRHLVVCLESSEDEEEEDEEEEEDMEVEESNESGGSSKENTATPTKSPRKTPKKMTRSAAKPKSKRRRIMVASDSDDADSGDEFKAKSSEDDDSSVSSGVDENNTSDLDTPSDPETPVKERKRKREAPKSAATPKTKPPTQSMTSFLTPSAKGASSEANRSFTPSVSSKTKSKLSAFSAPESTAPGGSTEEGRVFPHLSLEFIQPDKIKDGEKRPKSHSDYSPRTLYVPDSFLTRQTPGMRQWWDLKAKYYDSILFFKMGKFYELFHMDAVIGVNELGLIYMKGEHAHSGFPEIAYGRYAESLIQKGYKVARIEQTETPDMADERCKKMVRSTKFDKVVRREVCSVQTKGTKRYSFIDGDASDTSNAYLLAVCEKQEAESGSGLTYGVCFVDTSIGKFHLGQFEDDRHSSRLRTLISHFPPAQVLTERGKLSEKTHLLLTNSLPSVIRETLRSGAEFWDSSKTLKTLSEGDYLKGADEGAVVWPDTLKEMVSDADALGHTASEGSDLALSSLGAVIWYLRLCLMDDELVSMRDFLCYTPLDHQGACPEPANQLPAFITGRQKMVLDGVTLANLDILVNSSSGTTEGTLLERMDGCNTAFGKRVLKQWLCAPLCNPAAINARLDAIDDLMGAPEVTAEVTDLLKKMPDLERLLSKIHTLGSANRSNNHPDGRAIFFEDVTYSKRKIEDFLSALGGFKTSVDIISKFKSKAQDFKSALLRQLVSVAEDDGERGSFPDLTSDLSFFDKAFDHNKAKSEGVIKPSPGVDDDYDTAIDDMKTTTRELQDYLDQQKKRLGCRTLVYWGSGKNRYQMEVPDSVRHIPDQYEVTSSKKGYKRYRTPQIEAWLAEVTDAEERRDAALKDILRRIFYAFDKSYTKWSAAVQCLSVLDVLINLSAYSRCGEGAMCRPTIVTPAEGTQPHLEIRDGRHPCISRTFSGGDFIPNDVVIGIRDSQDTDADAPLHADSRVVLVTGPNMGGKSTLMRQVGLITVMAQLGCYVPAESCVLTPVDRVFTRLGASDRIMAGESTFFVELSETSAILQHATRHSLVLLDELGRGTATYDGTAIACAVVNELSHRSCRTLFSTHYHSLVDQFSHDRNVRLGHMACMVENECEEDPTQETITFLYKFVKGACPKSYGFNAARLADIPDEIITVAHKKAREFQQSCDQMRLFRNLCQMSSLSEDGFKELKTMINAAV